MSEKGPHFFEGNSHQSDQWKNGIHEMVLQGGVDTAKLRVGQSLEIKTLSGSMYTLTKKEDGFYISGTGSHFKTETKVKVNGALVGNGPSIRNNYVNRGARLELLPEEQHLEKGGFLKTVTTNVVKEIKEL